MAELVTMPEYRQVVVNELLRLEEDMLYTEKGHFAAANELHALHFALGLVTTVAAAASAATIVGETSSIASGSLALVAALTAAVLTFVKPDEKASQHVTAARLLGDIRVKSRQHRELDLHADSGTPAASWRALAEEIRAAKAEVDQSAPPVSDRRFKKAQAKIKSGDFVHDTVKD